MLRVCDITEEQQYKQLARCYLKNLKLDVEMLLNFSESQKTNTPHHHYHLHTQTLTPNVLPSQQSPRIYFSSDKHDEPTWTG